MIPVHLTIENFFGHKKSEIDFSTFNSAVIVGKNSNNAHISNGVGKSTIFKAIEYVLFNESSLKNIENIIRDGSDLSKITFDFIVNDNTYRIVRSRSRKGTSDLRLFLKNADTWEDITQRRISDTEKEIAKIIKINYKTFKNSVLFSQNDFEGLAVLTPEKRKQLLKDSLQLGNYSKLEALAKKRNQLLQKEIEKNTTLVEAIGDPLAETLKIQTEIDLFENNLFDKKNEFITNESKLTSLKDEISVLLHDNNAFKVKLDSLNEKVNQSKNFLRSIDLKKNETAAKAISLKGNLEKSLSEYKSLKDKFLESKKNTVEIDVVATNDRIHQISKELIDITSSIKSSKNKVSELTVPMPKDKTCKHCRSVLTEEHRIECQKEIDEEISSLTTQMQNLQETLNKLNSEKSSLQTALTQNESSIKTINDLKNKLLLKQKDIESDKVIFEDYKSNLEKLKVESEDKNKEVIIIEEERNSLDTQDYDLRVAKINALRTDSISFQRNIELTNKEIGDLTSKISVFKDRLLTKESDVNKLKTLNDSLQVMEKDIIIHQNVVQAFGTGGIPALIIHNMLDDLQQQANSVLEQIRPGLQLKFSVIKDGKNGEQDTLDIHYIINGQDREFEQLSGAQKLLITLSLRLALSLVIQRSLGIDIKLLLLDEVDPALDRAGVEAFFDMIKIIEKDFKVIIISHNDDLKDKFSHAILVEQDQAFVSNAKVVSSW
jgi:DNA repair exonuclease SbcCD ATPase subunit